MTPAGLRSLAGLRIAVTGASGFCGAVVARRAEAAGADVVCLGRRPGPVGKFTPWDATRARPDLAGADVVVHLAAAVGDTGAGRAVEEMFRAVNVDGSRRLLDAAHGRPVVWVSSASVYDPNRDRSLVGEDHPIRGQLSAYGRTKAAGDQLALDAAAVVLRPRAVYGDGDRHLLPRIRRSVRAGVALLPGPDVRLSLTAVDNLADACLVAYRWPAGAYNIADVEPYWRDATIRAVLASTGSSARLLHVPLPLATLAAAIIGVARPVLRSEPLLTRYAVDQVAHDVVLDITKARAQGWQPRVALSDFLATLPKI